jgi:hypothetical protein
MWLHIPECADDIHRLGNRFFIFSAQPFGCNGRCRRVMQGTDFSTVGIAARSATCTGGRLNRVP